MESQSAGLDLPDRWRGYIVALAATVTALSLQLAFGDWLGDSLLPMTAAVLAAAWYGGWPAGLLTTLLGGALSWFLLPLPRTGLWLDSPADRVRLLMFVLVGLLVSRLCEAFRSARRRLETERARLREADAFHTAIAELSTDFAFSARVGPDGSIVPEAVTDGFKRLLGFTLHELPEGGWAALLHPDEREPARRYVQRLLRGHTVEGEARHVARDGRTLLLQYSVRPLWDERGRVVRVYGAYRDVTRERQAEREVLDRERQLRLVADNAPVMIAHCDREGRFKFVNRRYAERFGLAASDFPGRPVREVVGDAAYAELEPHIDTVLSGVRVEFDGTLPGPGPQTVPVRVAFEPERDREGRVSGFVSAAVSTAEQRRAELELRKSEERLRLALHGARQGTWDWDLGTGQVSWDARCSEIFGWKRPAVLTLEDHVDVAHPEDRDALVEALQGALREGSQLEHEHRIVARDGRARWVQVRGQGFYGEGGHPYRMSGTVLDVTERRTLEEALRESEARFRQMTEAMPHIAFTATPDGTLEYVNSQWHRFAGRPEDESFGLAWLQVLHPEDYTTVYRRWTHALRTGEPFEVEYRFRSGDGSYRWHLCRALAVRDAAGRIAKWVGTSTDVHDQKRTQQALERSERLYRAVGESIDYGVWICDPAGRNTYASESFLKLIGLTQEQCAGLGWTEALHPEEVERTRAAWNECVRSGGLWDVELRYRGADGEYHPVLSRAVQVKDAGGRVVAWAGINLDIRRLKEAEDALRAADRRKDEFLATLAHELRNPLNPIRSAVQVLRATSTTDEEQAWSRDVIDRQLDHLTRLIDDLLDISRISSGKLELRKERVELGEVLHGALEASRTLFEQLGHELETSLPGEPLYVDGDVVRLTQVFLNLLNNAAKYTDRGGRIRLSVRREGGQAFVSVRDTGVGIAPEKLPRLFEMFYQVDATLERTQGGLGIGLSLVRQLVALHGGRIRAHSEGVGRGSEFVVSLPLRPAPVHVPELREPAGTAAEHPRRRVLVVDDNPDSASSLALVLQLAGHEVETASDGEEALAKAELRHPEVVLLDLGMPRMSGYEVCRRIRARPWGAEVVLVAQTGWGQEEDRRRTREVGFDAHLVKPVEAASLEQLIERLERGANGGEREPNPQVH